MMRVPMCLALAFWSLLAVACRGSGEPHRTVVEPWPEADALFHQDPRWLGSDGGISVDLGGGRSVWLFPDSFVALGSEHRRESSCLVRNTVGVMEGSDPEAATMTFHWRTGQDGQPESFFPAGRDICFQEDDEWLWPGDGERLGTDGPLLVLLSLVRPTPGEGLGFQEAGWSAVLVENPDDDPEAWRTEYLTPPPNRWDIRLGPPGVFVHDGWMYAYGTSGSFDVHLARWRLERAAGDLGAPEWWTGDERGFVPEAALVEKPPALFGEALPESIYAADGWVALQTVGFGGASLGVRTAPAPTGPWSRLEEVWSPPESARPGVLVYGFEAHPELDAGGAVALTYATNAEDFGDVVADESLGYPRFARLRLAR